jgi:hypothetical protein
VNIADTPSDADAFVERYAWKWPQIADPERELAGSLGLTGHPAVAAIDEEGRVVARHVGGGDRETWEALAAELR